MKTRNIVLLAALLFLPELSVRGQLVVDGQTRTLNGVTSNLIGTLTVGTNGAFTRLIVTNTAKLSNNTMGVIGASASARSNSVVVTGNSSRWSIGSSFPPGSSFRVGDGGSFNELRVLNGGRTEAINGYLGSQSGASNNLLLVSGPGAFVTNQNELYVGQLGAGNRLVISNQGSVAIVFGFVGGSGPSNQAVITGPGSIWWAREVRVGDGSRGNEMSILNGGTVSDVFGSIGYPATNANDNLVTVSGANSYWYNREDLTVGWVGRANRLVITNGGWVASSNGYVGRSSYAASNQVAVSGANSWWHNSADIFLGGSGSDNTVRVAAGGHVFNYRTYLGRFAFAASNNVASVSGAGSAWTNTAEFVVGSLSAGNQLQVSAGGRVQSGEGIVGDQGTNNLAVVTNPGSLWTNTFFLRVGRGGVGNRLMVSDGGIVASPSAIVGDLASGRSNLVFVSDPGSAWHNAFDLLIGNMGADNHLVVSNRGVVTTRNGYVGYTSNNFNPARNRVTVTGTGSLWRVGLDLRVGYFGGLNQLIISDGGQVQSAQAFLGTSNLAGLAHANLALVTGPGSLWTNEIALIVGGGSSLNQLIVSNGAVVATISGGLGLEPSSVNNRAVITGPGSRWTNFSGLAIGLSGPANQLIVSNAATVASSYGWLGRESSSGGNFAQISGSNTAWRVSGDLQVGILGSDNRLVVSDAAAVTANRLFLGASGLSSNNSVVILGGTLQVAQAIDVQGGILGLSDGRVEAELLLATGETDSRIGFGGGTLVVRGGEIRLPDASGLGSRSFVAGVSGTVPAILDVRAGQPFVLASNLFVLGRGPSNCRLYITNGGTLRVTADSASPDTGSSWISANPGAPPLGSTGNIAVISGANSLWESEGDLRLGHGNGGNQLLVNNGGTVAARNVYVGSAGIAFSNTLTLAGGLLRAGNTVRGVVDVQGGLLRIDSGVLITDELRLVNGAHSKLAFNGGSLRTRDTACANGSPFVVGDGLSGATLELAGDGAHYFANGLMISSNSLLQGNGSILGNVTVARGATFSPGASIGQLHVDGSLALADGSTNVFELNKAAGTNDAVLGLTTLTYGGTLQLASVGGPIAAGDTFKLFQASNYGGNFSAVLPSAPGTGLRWNLHRLPVDGVLRVFSVTSAPPHIDTVLRSMGTNLLITASGGVAYDPVVLLTATNLLTPVAAWQRLATNHFDSAGQFNLTNLISTEPQRFFRLQVE